MASTVAARRTLAGFFLQEAPPSPNAIIAFDRKRIGAGLLALDAATFGADLYGRTVTHDVLIDAHSTVLHSLAGRFVAADVGKKIYLQGAGAAGATHVARIASYTSAILVGLDIETETAVYGDSPDATGGIAAWGFSKDRVSSDGSQSQATGFTSVNQSGAGDVPLLSGNGAELIPRRLIAGTGISLDVGGGAAGPVTINAGGSSPTVRRKSVDYSWDGSVGGLNPGHADSFFTFPTGPGQLWEVDFHCFLTAPYPAGTIWLGFACDDAVAGACGQWWHGLNEATNPPGYARGGLVDGGFTGSFLSIQGTTNADRSGWAHGRAYVLTGAASSSSIFLQLGFGGDPLPGAGVIFLAPSVMVGRRLS